ncbi:iron ABC transporter permease [Microbacterium sp. Root61]|uniref:FecCD family ABC transporter permease n=1 Tax=Microbacterium sp. Root61 TaxID=1736570 RepID=UPI0006FE035E|nr:iron chelate uptake ABC transporter family permease subunit [Microbacterium sp. Root61]KRA23594.1 iron ABC transporter permease [Microbacterium sp. Root61]
MRATSAGTWLVRLDHPQLSLRLHRRSIWVGLAIGLLVLVAGVATLSTGTSDTPLADVLAALVGSGDARTNMLVIEWRLPRLLFATVCGAALGLSGAVFQSLTRNPLGSPDVIGFSAGSYFGALVVMLLFGSLRYWEVATGALLGGIATAIVVYALSYRGGVHGFRLIIMGIGVTAVIGSFNSYLLLTSALPDAMVAASWGAGSLSGLAFDQFWPMLIVFVVLVPLAIALGPSLRQLELGDDTARALGLRAEPARLAAIVIGVALIALVTAAAGPIAFIALAAPQVAKRLTKTSGIGLLPAALTGALLLVVADLIAIRIALPVGVVTVSIGGGYLLWLLIREFKGKAR